MLLFRIEKLTSKNVADTTFKADTFGNAGSIYLRKLLLINGDMKVSKS